MAYHYGQLALAVKHFRMSMESVDKILASPNQQVETAGIFVFATWFDFAADLNLPECRAAHAKFELTDERIDKIAPFSSFPIRPRGTTTAGYPVTAEYWSLWHRFASVHLSDDTREIEQACADIPSWDDYLPTVLARYTSSLAAKC